MLLHSCLFHTEGDYRCLQELSLYHLHFPPPLKEPHILCLSGIRLKKAWGKRGVGLLKRPLSVTTGFNTSLSPQSDRVRFANCKTQGTPCCLFSWSLQFKERAACCIFYVAWQPLNHLSLAYVLCCEGNSQIWSDCTMGKKTQMALGAFLLWVEVFFQLDAFRSLLQKHEALRRSQTWDAKGALAARKTLASI